MASQNIRATRIAPSTAGALTLEVLRRRKLSPHFSRVTLGGDDLARFNHLGYDQWFRLFLPTDTGSAATSSLSRMPDKLGTLDYVKYLMINKSVRPILRNYTVRQFRPAGVDAAELDVDFVLHPPTAEADHSGPAASWATSCSPGDRVAILDEGASYNPPASAGDRVVLVADESGLPALAGILASLPPDARGRAVIEIPDQDDRQRLDHPDGVVVNWIIRADDHAVPGQAALAAVVGSELPAAPFYGFVVGEQALATGVRRHWVAAGVPKHHITFCGYWRHGAHG
ncbi:MAG TPA: siderophore-interacting protein [Microlunatus sp.]